MKLGLYFIVFILLAFGYKASEISYFNATFEGVQVRLRWTVANPQTIESFEVSRKKDSEDSYFSLGQVNSSENNEYEFIDDRLFKMQEEGNITYQLKLNYKDGSDKLYFTTLNHQPTSIERSWGSIKAMFK